jgi:anti-anti-sigma factor
MIENFRRVRAPRRLDSNSSPQFEQELRRYIDSGDILLVLDLSQLEFISSAGLRLLIVVAKRLKAEGGRLALCAPRKPVQDVLDASGYGLVFDVFPSCAAAVAHVSMR